ncbi:formylglycine-generating enzyme family protein, partial [Desulfobulbus sp. TB]|nr:formylglycine-generating enzyme family protein [Desulfobulbus sp. TB]
MLNIDPLSKEELAVPTFVPWESNESPPSPFSNKRPIAQPNQDRFLDNLVASTAESLSVPCNKRRQIRKKKTEKTVRRKKQAAKKNALRIRRLLGLLSVAAYIDPFLLQETVRLIPSSPSSSSVRTGATASGIATENALRSHPDTEQDSKMLLALKSEKKEMYYQIFAQEDEQMQTDMLTLLRQRDATHSPLLFALELLPVLPFLESPVIQKQLIGWLESFILRLVRTWFDQFDHQENIHLTLLTPLITLIQHAEKLLQLIKMLPQKCKRQITAHSFLYGIAYNNKLRSGAVLSPEYDPERVIQTVQKAMWPVSYQVLQQGEKLFLYPSSEALSPHLPGSPLVDFELSVDCLLVQNKRGIATLPVQAGMLVHDCTEQGKEVYLQTPTEQFVFTTCFRPSWAKTIGRHKKGLFVDTSWLGITHRLLWTNSTGEGAGHWNGCGPLQTDQYGLFIDLKITDRVTQRFRKITPGWFMMGSPKDEPERESWGKESLHEVILTKEFWVADTVVTQELWQAVMGNNPSFFSGVHRPIEQVSYQDAIFFLQHLNKGIPGIRTRLLTEAEWEYCCRAGSATPFYFGSRITPDQVNYNGQYPYLNGLVGKNRRESVPVKSFPCNEWGLFEMHGNVWEWCQDYWQEDLFSQEPQV